MNPTLFISALAFACLAPIAHAGVPFEPRFSVNPEVSLENLEDSPGQVELGSTGCRNYHCTADVSVVLEGISAKSFVDAATDYANYSRFIPKTRSSSLLEESCETNSSANCSYLIHTCVYGSNFGVAYHSCDFMNAHKIELTRGSASGISWTLNKTAGPRGGWVTDSLQNSLEGSIYVKDLGGRKVYVRYYLRAVFNESRVKAAAHLDYLPFVGSIINRTMTQELRHSLSSTRPDIGLFAALALEAGKRQ